MGFADELKKFKQKIGIQKRDVNDGNTDMDEMRESGISIPRGDARLKNGIRPDNMTTEELQKLRRYRMSK